MASVEQKWKQNGRGFSTSGDSVSSQFEAETGPSSSTVFQNLLILGQNVYSSCVGWLPHLRAYDRTIGTRDETRAILYFLFQSDRKDAHAQAISPPLFVSNLELHSRLSLPESTLQYPER